MCRLSTDCHDGMIVVIKEGGYSKDGYVYPSFNFRHSYDHGSTGYFVMAAERCVAIVAFFLLGFKWRRKFVQFLALKCRRHPFYLHLIFHSVSEAATWWRVKAAWGSRHLCFPCPRPSHRLFRSLVELQSLDPQLDAALLGKGTIWTLL